MPTAPRRILWIDDEVELFEPHLIFLRQRGYQVDVTTNGDDALELARRSKYDLVLLDEQMPGKRGLDVLADLRRVEPDARVVMVTKSEEDRTMVEAIGRRVDEYLVKPASPRQVLSVVTRLLEGAQLQQQRAAQDFAARFGELARQVEDAADWQGFFAAYEELVRWELRLQDAGEGGLADSVQAQLVDLRRNFGRYVARSYGTWTARRQKDRPTLSVDIVARYLAPLLDGGGPVLFMVIDCMRLDQWRVMRPLLGSAFDVEEELYASILPTATPFSRNAIFSGKYPDALARERPEWWAQEEGSLNAFEDELLRAQLRSLGHERSVHYEKVFSDADADALLGRVRGAFRQGSVVAAVFNFVDMLTHGRSESAILMEVARDVPALRALTRQWFEQSSALRVIREAAAEGVSVVVTSDHGSILCQTPTTIYARRDATANLRYKYGLDLRAEEPDAVYSVRDETELRFPPARPATNYLLALEDRFFVYPTKLREYQNRYRGSFLHGGVSPEEMILPVATLRPR